MDQNFATIQGAVTEDPALTGRVKLVSISFDPETDTAAVLAAHGATRRADETVWTFLTGDRATVHRFAGRFGVGVIRPEGMTEINHNLRTALIGRDGRIRRLYSGNGWTPGEVLADLRLAVAEP
jgi:protein SCO1/2